MGLSPKKKASAPEVKAPDAGGGLPPNPPFNMVFYPRLLRVDGQAGHQKYNYAFEAAVSIYHRPAVQRDIAKLVERKRGAWQADRSTMNWEIFSIVIDALLADLEANTDRYANNPSDASNPVAHCLRGRTAVESRRILKDLATNARQELQANLVVKENVGEPSR